MAATYQTSGSWPGFVALDGANQWWSDVQGWHIPHQEYPDGTRLNMSAQGLAGTGVRLRRRVRATYNGGTAGPAETCGPNVTQDMSDAFPVPDLRYEYDIGVPTGAFVAAVYVKLGV